MSKIKVAVLVGSLRKDSFNRRLVRAVKRLAPEILSFENIRIDDLPLYNQEMDGQYPEVCKRFKQQIEAADALLMATPEYNRSIPGALKNALDIGSRPWGTNSFRGKPGGIIGASIGATGSAMAQQHLRNVLSYLDVSVLNQPEVFLKLSDELIDAEGNLSSESTRKFLQSFVDKYVAWLQRHLQV